MDPKDWKPRTKLGAALGGTIVFFLIGFYLCRIQSDDELCRFCVFVGFPVLTVLYGLLLIRIFGVDRG